MNPIRRAADLVAVDIGNSKTLVVLIRQGRLRGRFRLDHATLSDRQKALGWRSMLRAVQALGTDRTTGLVSSVAPRSTPGFLEVARRVRGRNDPRFRVLTWQDPWPFRIELHKPETVGIDRLANVAGLVGLGLQSGVAVDVGTAITLDLLRAGSFVGGLIAPGPHLGARALHEGVLHLPWVDPTGEVPLVGRDTRSAIRAGIHHLTRFGVRGLAERLRAMIGPRSRIVVTGSGGELVARDLGVVFEPDLWLLGLRLVRGGTRGGARSGRGGISL